MCQQHFRHHLNSGNEHLLDGKNSTGPVFVCLSLTASQTKQLDSFKNSPSVCLLKLSNELKQIKTMNEKSTKKIIIHENLNSTNK